MGSCNGRCGDGSIDTVFQEACDGLNLNLQTCETRGYYGGALACGEDCRNYDETGCMVEGRCGDGEVQATYGEQCDGVNLDAQTCVTLGYSQGSGALACTACAFDEAACVPRNTNADLATLTVSSGTLTPSFSAGTTSYTVTVPLEVTTLTVAATAADPYATMSITPAQPMTLSLGANPATVTVTAESGAQKVYTVVITRLMDYESANIGTLRYVPGGTFQRDATVTNLSTVSA